MNDFYSRMGIDIDKLGCVMLDCEPPTELLDLVPDFFWYHDPERPGDYGPVLDSHVTLLFGLLTPETAPGPTNSPNPIPGAP